MCRRKCFWVSLLSVCLDFLRAGSGKWTIEIVAKWNIVGANSAQKRDAAGIGGREALS